VQPSILGFQLFFWRLSKVHKLLVQGHLETISWLLAMFVSQLLIKVFVLPSNHILSFCLRIEEIFELSRGGTSV
jgi:DNA integrity scanning protein DisA with diadenylate cyclase activity